ncbi:putative minor structural protein [Streptococcus phage Javan425]|uniref:Phage tail component, N-terminal domain protein n=1 Tax=Streptococcus porcinus str. Jelinkova 176 TaxID=873448 RepID=A0ABP2KZY8_STRPO|nr:distal tail protein Dit [Streptococcus porcinus]EGJ27544.1 putative phage tail component, N-terminal domain protein [Streptococcus porcinus str. Jelinkova 176]QBX18395.1 putative minor structural protein [Streptococcus phage Javan423]QBX18416.1 putative minor structural protein [Streptococcus phage Javan425]SQG44005.1 prophage LambdaSa03, tail component [Streptococcus porcinus]
MSYKTVRAYLNDIELTQWITIKPGFTIFKGSDKKLDLKNFDDSNGSIFLGTSYGHKVIEVPFYVKYETINDYDAFQLALRLKEPKKLRFDIAPDRYFMAIPVNDLDFDEIKLNGSGKITFVIPEGVARSNVYKRVQNYTLDGNKLTFQIENNGTEEALPIITIKHNSENGYIGLANQTGVFALGSPEAEDGAIVTKNEVLFDYSKAIAQSLEGAKNVGVLNYMAPTYDTELKRMRFDNILGSGKGGEYVVIGNRGTTPGYGEHEGTLTWDIAPDSNGEYTLNEHLWWSQVFIAVNQDRKGFLKMCVSGIKEDGTEEFLYGIETYKRKNGTETEYNFFALDDDGIGWRFYKKFTFSSENSKRNPFSMSRGRATEIFREEDKFRIFFDGKHYPVSVPSLRGKKSRKVHLAMGTCSDSRKYIDYMLFEKLRFEKMGVSHYNNIVNKYQPGDKVVINFEDDSVETKDVDSIQDMLLGSEPLTIPPGTSEFVIHLSSWISVIPEITIDFEERFL